MRKCQIAICLIVLLSVTGLTAQNATVSFRVDKNSQAIIYDPIDEAFNERVPTQELILLPGKEVHHTVEVKTFCFLYLKFPQYSRTCVVLLFPNDSVRISLDSQQLKIAGNNQYGHQFYYDNFKAIPFGDNYRKMADIFQEYTDSKRDINSIIPTIDKELISSYFATIEQLSDKSYITRDCAEVLKTQILLKFIPDIVDLFKVTSKRSKNRETFAADSLVMQNKIDSLLHLYPFSKEIYKYDSRLFVIKYTREYFETKEYTGKYDTQIFGPYKRYLHAPKEMQPNLFLGACLVQLKYDSEEMDLKAFKSFYNKEFPNHPYTNIVNKALQDISVPLQEGFTPLYIESQVNSLSSLTKEDKLKGKYLFIDLWASWCMPCRKEFNYQKQLHRVLDGFKDIALVYISIDKEQQAAAWKNCINYYKLNGFHLRATPVLQENIQKEIYKDEPFEIPRYILIAPEGEILNGNLPRPSEYSQLKEALEQAIKH